MTPYYNNTANYDTDEWISLSSFFIGTFCFCLMDPYQKWIHSWIYQMFSPSMLIIGVTKDDQDIYMLISVYVFANWYWVFFRRIDKSDEVIFRFFKRQPCCFWYLDSTISDWYWYMFIQLRIFTIVYSAIVSRNDIRDLVIDW